mmetsp:Transcript_141717/g.395117  ORF Transcript_141717/g.395117 Transcript_141717/m.395117 type:complete len:250 (-) Transcript_141717:56-805(-)
MFRTWVQSSFFELVPKMNPKGHMTNSMPAMNATAFFDGPQIPDGRIAQVLRRPPQQPSKDRTRSSASRLWAPYKSTKSALCTSATSSSAKSMSRGNAQVAATVEVKTNARTSCFTAASSKVCVPKTLIARMRWAWSAGTYCLEPKGGAPKYDAQWKTTSTPTRAGRTCAESVMSQGMNSTTPCFSPAATMPRWSSLAMSSALTCRTPRASSSLTRCAPRKPLAPVTAAEPHRAASSAAGRAGAPGAIWH